MDIEVHWSAQGGLLVPWLNQERASSFSVGL